MKTASPDAKAVVYRGFFELPCDMTKVFRWSADERAQLFIDGELIANGPERGCPERWYLAETEVPLNSGKHVLTARVLQFGLKDTADGQMTVAHGFHIEDTDGIFSEWKYQVEEGLEFTESYPDWGVFPKVKVTLGHNHEILQGQGGEWLPVEYFEDCRELNKPDLPPMEYRRVFPDKTDGGLSYFSEYECVWCIYHFSGKGKVEISWMETPYLDRNFDIPNLKGNKGCRNGREFWAGCDTFEVDGEYLWYDYWWKAGHYTQINVVCGEVDVRREYYHTGYPLPELQSGDPVKKAAYQTLRGCSWEVLMDCPYYEQLGYIGDSRIQSLCHYFLGEKSLPEKMMRIFVCAQEPDGFFRSRYPSKKRQVIPSFSLIFIYMLHDYFTRFGCNDFVREILPAAEKLGNALICRLKDGLLMLEGWNFIDWHPCWPDGVPPNCKNDSSCILNWMAVLALRNLFEISQDSRFAVAADKLEEEIFKVFYIPEQKIFADNRQHTSFSEHSQVMALLAAPQRCSHLAETLRDRSDLIPCSIAFSVYYFEVCKRFHLDDLREKRMAKYRNLLTQGLTTFPEEFKNPRSDCHAWSSHVLFA